MHISYKHVWVDAGADIGVAIVFDLDTSTLDTVVVIIVCFVP